VGSYFLMELTSEITSSSRAKKTIKHIVKQACDKDVIVLLGKGNEKYQIIEDVKSHHDDKEIPKAGI